MDRRRRLGGWGGAIFAALLAAGCALRPPPLPPGPFHDALFGAPSAPVDPGAALRVSPAMRAFVTTRLGHGIDDDRRQRLVQALRVGELKLEYDAAITRTAAEAFDARAGNCLALVLMSAALARELNLEPRFQAVIGPADWERDGTLMIGVGHVNLVLEDRRDAAGFFRSTAGSMVIDFLPARDAAALVTRPIEERTVIAMYLNNRAVESLSAGRLDDAYAYAREAIRTDPAFLEAQVTLAVVYRTARHAMPALAALDRVLEREPEHAAALSNRVLVLRDLRRSGEADAVAARLAALEPHPPYSYFREGLAALEAGRAAAASRLFAKEVARSPFRPEFEFWLGISYWRNADVERALRHLKRAVDLSTPGADRELYGAKLAYLRSLRRPE